MNDGGFAFPSAHVIREPDRPFTIGDVMPIDGMSYRQWLIGMAASGILSDPNVRLNMPRDYQAVANQSVNVADAIIAALEKEGK